MNESDDVVTVPWVVESSEAGAPVPDETLIENSHARGQTDLLLGGVYRGDVANSLAFVDSDGVGGAVAEEGLPREAEGGDRSVGCDMEEVNNSSSQNSDAAMGTADENPETVKVPASEGVEVRSKEVIEEDRTRNSTSLTAGLLDNEAQESGIVRESLLIATNTVAEEDYADDKERTEYGLIEDSVDQASVSVNRDADSIDQLTLQQECCSDETRNREIEAGALCPSETEGSLTAQAQLHYEEAETEATEEGLINKDKVLEVATVATEEALNGKIEVPGVSVVAMEKVLNAEDEVPETAVVYRDKALDNKTIPDAGIVADEEDKDSKDDVPKVAVVAMEEGCLSCEDEVLENGITDTNVHSSEVNHSLSRLAETDEVAANIGDLDQQGEILGVDLDEANINTPEPFSIGKVDDEHCVNAEVEYSVEESKPAAAIDGAVDPEVLVSDSANQCSENECFVEGSKPAAAIDGAVDLELLVSDSANHASAVGEVLTTGKEIKEDNEAEDQCMDVEAVGENSKPDSAVDTQPEFSSDAIEFVGANEFSREGGKAQNVIEEDPATEDKDGVLAAPLALENTKSDTFERNAAEHGVVSTEMKPPFEEAHVDDGMDIDEVLSWKDEVPENAVNFEGLHGSLVSSCEPSQICGESNNDGINNELSTFEVEAEKSNSDSAHYPLELDSSKGNIVSQELEENMMPLMQPDCKEEANTEGDDRTIVGTDLQKDKTFNSLSVDGSAGKEGLKQVEVLSSDAQATIQTQGIIECQSSGALEQGGLPSLNQHLKGDKLADSLGEDGAINDEEYNKSMLGLAQHDEAQTDEVYQGQNVKSPAIDELLTEEDKLTLIQEANCIEVDGQEMGNIAHLQISECSDVTVADATCTPVENVVEDDEQFTLRKHPDKQGTEETSEETTEDEESTSTSEKIQEPTEDRINVPLHQFLYFHPPENEGTFSVSDLVWGKVRSHPWWPGQIFDPSDASETAMKYHRRDCYLVAYFGDRTFAWNDDSVLKPFRACFSEIEKHGNSETFHHAVKCALEEVSRRVELGLACSCTPQDAYDKIEFQVIDNTGINKESSVRRCMDKSAGAISFEPRRTLEYARALAQYPQIGCDKLDLVIAKAQLSSYAHYRGYRMLPEFLSCGEILENDADSLETSDATENDERILDEKGMIESEHGSSHKRKNYLDSSYPIKKEKSMSELMVDSIPCSFDDEEGPEGVDGSKLVSSQRTVGAAKAYGIVSSTHKPSFKVGECIRRVASQLTGSPSILKCSGELNDYDISVDNSEHMQKGRLIFSSNNSLVEVLSQLHLIAQDPMKRYSFLNSVTTFFSICRTSLVLNKSRRQSLSAGRPRKRKGADVVNNFPEEYEFDDVNDTYWTDRIVQNYSEDQILHDNENGSGNYQMIPLEPNSRTPKSGRRPKSRKRFSTGQEIEAEEPAAYVEQRRQDLPTEVGMIFTEGNALPSELSLNKMFRRFGPIMESETEVDRQINRARVVFKRCSDAEVAFSSAGKFNIFGTMIVHYELNYTPLVSYKPLPLATLPGEEGVN